MAILWLDLGNTRLKYWVIDPNNHIITSDAREHLKAPNELLIGLIGTFAQYALSFVGVSSVLGSHNNQKIAQTLSLLNVPFEFAQVDDQHTDLKSHYNPTQLGVDRWLQMLGAVNRMSHQCVIGCGTALTIDLIEHGVHLGGYILPNAYMQRHALYAGTHQIAVKAGRFDSLALGCTTFDAVNHGILFGIVATVRAIISAYPDFYPILTGGGSVMLKPHLGDICIDDNLLLQGLQRYFWHKTQV